MACILLHVLRASVVNCFFSTAKYADYAKRDKQSSIANDQFKAPVGWASAHADGSGTKGILTQRRRDAETTEQGSRSGFCMEPQMNADER